MAIHIFTSIFMAQLKMVDKDNIDRTAESLENIEKNPINSVEKWVTK